MKKRTKSKIIALLLSMTVVLSGISPVFVSAADDETAYTADCPYIFVHGFMGSTVYKDPTDPDSDPVWPPSGDDIKTAVKRGIPAFIKLAFTHNWDKFGDEAVSIATDLFSASFLPPDGTASNGSGVRWEYPKPETITANSQLSFRYDWRLSPLDAAAGLNDFINYVLDCSGAEQVVLECHSYGGVVATTYAKLYGTQKVRSWAYNSTAVYGETYNGELFTGQLTFDAKALTEYLDGVFDHNKNEKLLDFLFKVLYKTGITGLACRIVNKLSEKIGMKKLSQGIIPMFGGWLSVWSMIPDDMIDDAYDFVFNYVWDDDPTDRSGLKEKIAEYNEQIRPYKTETLRQINNDANLYVFTRYGYSGMFLTPSWNNETDTLIDVKNASFGATTALHGEELSKDYLQGVEAEYVSPEKNIDASTCLFPEQTWFIKNLSHSEGSYALDEMIKILLYNDGQATVKSYSNYPRYMLYNDKTEELEAVK